MLRIIQISDMHLCIEKNIHDCKEYRCKNSTDILIDALIKDLKKNYLNESELKKRGLEPMLFFVGDALNNGGFSFKNVSSFSVNNESCGFSMFKEIFMDRILSEFECLRNKIFITPGNHDVTTLVKDIPTKDDDKENSKENINNLYDDEDSINEKNRKLISIVRQNVENSETIDNTQLKKFYEWYNPRESDPSRIIWMQPYLDFEHGIYGNYKSNSGNVDNKMPNEQNVNGLNLKSGENKCHLSNIVNTFFWNCNNGNGDVIKVGIACINTAWLSRIMDKDDVDKDKEPKEIEFPMIDAALQDAINLLETAEFKILCTHYPIDSLLDERDIKEKVKKNFDIVINGHSHILRTIIEDSVREKKETLFSVAEATLGKQDGNYRTGYKIIDYYHLKGYETHHRVYSEDLECFVPNLSLAAEKGIRNFYLSGGILVERMIDDVLSDSIERIKMAKEMRIVGMGRQDYAQKNKGGVMTEYYGAIEKRLCESSEEGFKVKRLTSIKLTEKFKNHLSECFINAYNNKSKNYSIEVAFLEDMDLRLTYYIIDKDYLAITIYRKEEDSSDKWDCPYAYCSTDETTVKQFILLFDNVWEKKIKNGEVISAQENFEEVVPIADDLIKKIDQVETVILKLASNIPKDSLRYAIMMNEIDRINVRWGALEHNLIPMQINEGKKQMQSILKNIMLVLQERRNGGTYKTISFYEYWNSFETIDNSIAPQENNSFISANNDALKNEKVNITRIYIINSESFENDELYKIYNMNFIKHNLEIKEKNKNYEFRVLFRSKDKYEKMLKEHCNSALWDTDKEKALITLNYRDIGTSNVYLSDNEFRIVDKNVNIVENEVRDNHIKVDKWNDDFDKLFREKRSSQEIQLYSKIINNIY